MVDHDESVDLWQHDFNSVLARILTKGNSIKRVLREGNEEELHEIASSLRELYDELHAMSTELFIELRRLKDDRNDSV
jgi:hypothetical protein